MIARESGRLNIDIEDLEDRSALKRFLGQHEIDGVDQMHSHQFWRGLEQQGFGREGRMGAQMAVLAQSLQLSPGDLADSLGVVRGVLDDPALQLEELANVTDRGRIIPGLKEGRRGGIAHRA